MKSILLLYLIYYHIEDSISYRDDDDKSGYPRMYQLRQKDSKPLKSRIGKNKPLIKMKNVDWFILRALENMTKPQLAVLVGNADRIAKLAGNPSIKRKIKISRNSQKQKQIQSLAEQITSNVKLKQQNKREKPIDDEVQDGDDYYDSKEAPKDEYRDTQFGQNPIVHNPEEYDGGEMTDQDEPKGNPDYRDQVQELPKNYHIEIDAGDLANLVQNNHKFVPMKYTYEDLGRRFVLQYPYTEVHKVEGDVENLAELQLDEAIREALQQTLEDERLMPVKASPEKVIAIAKESALLESSKPVDLTEDIVQNNLLRTGEFWNSYWQEDVPNPQEISLRSEKNQKEPKLETVRVKIMPGSRLYQLVAQAKKISPRLLYIINANKDPL